MFQFWGQLKVFSQPSLQISVRYILQRTSHIPDLKAGYLGLKVTHIQQQQIEFRPSSVSNPRFLPATSRQQLHFACAADFHGCWKEISLVILILSARLLRLHLIYTGFSSRGKAKLRVFHSAIARKKSTQLSPSLIQKPCTGRIGSNNTQLGSIL